MKILSSFKNTVQRLTSFKCGMSVEIYLSSGDMYTQHQFMCEKYWLTVHFLYMREMQHELNK